MDKKLKIVATVAISSVFLAGCDSLDLPVINNTPTPEVSEVPKPLAGVPATKEPAATASDSEEVVSGCEVTQPETEDDFVNVAPIQS